MVRRMASVKKICMHAVRRMASVTKLYMVPQYSVTAAVWLSKPGDNLPRFMLTCPLQERLSVPAAPRRGRTTFFSAR